MHNRMRPLAPLQDGRVTPQRRAASARPGSPAPARTRAGTRPWLVGTLVVLCVLAGYLFTFNVDQPAHNGDWYLRYQVTCAIVEHNSFSLQPYQHDARTGPGVGHRIYAQYTLGQSVAMIPLYLLGRTLAGLPHTRCSGHAPPIVFLTCKLLDPIVGAMLCALGFATARLLGYGRRTALALTLLLAFGTALWPDVLSGEEHTMESLFLLAAAYAALRYTLARRPSRLWVLAMGLAAGLVFVTRVAGVIALPIFALYLLVLHRHRQRQGWRRAAWCDLTLFAAGAAPAVLVNAAYNVVRFGSPLRSGPHADHSFFYPPWLGVPNLLVSPGKGLLWYTPAVLLLLLAARPFWRRCPLPARLFALISAVYLLFYATVTYWHGDPAWGPRYLYAVLPYLILPLGELWRRWRHSRRPVRGLVVGVLAASFLVQLLAVSVSYWRHFQDIMAYHGDQVARHDWGFDLNYWWTPAQSPLVFAAQGLTTIVQNGMDHASLLAQPAAQLGNPGDMCMVRLLRHVAVCLTYADALRYGAASNTFTMWWTHAYPWWSAGTVRLLALALLAVFLVSGGALIALLRPRPRALAPSAPAAAPPGWTWPGRLTGHTGRPSAGLRPLGASMVLACGAYAALCTVAVVTAPRAAPRLLQTLPMRALVRDGTWAYRVVRVVRLAWPTEGVVRSGASRQYLVVQVQLHNLSGRPDHMSIRWFALTDAAGRVYPWMPHLTAPLAEVLHLSRFEAQVPARRIMEGALVALARTGGRHLELLGPGLALIRLQQ